MLFFLDVGSVTVILLESCSATVSVDVFQHTILALFSMLCALLMLYYRGSCLNYARKFVLIADWSVAHFVVIVNDIMNDNMAAFAHVGARLVRSFIGPDV